MLESLPRPGFINIATSLLLTLAITCLTWLVLPWIGELWSLCITWSEESVPMASSIDHKAASVLGRSVVLAVPVVELLPPSRIWLYTVAIYTGATLLSIAMVPQRSWGVYLPLAIAVVLLIAIQLIACFCAVFSTPAWNSSLYVMNGLLSSLRFLLVVPFALWATYGIWAGSWRRLVGAQLIACWFLAVFPPFQYLSHLLLIRAGSTLFLPVVHILLGSFLQVSVLIAIYGYAVSWQPKDGQ